MNSTKFAIVRLIGEALCRRRAPLFVFAVAAWLFTGEPGLANDDFWDTAASGTWQIGSNWLDNTTPAGSDTANFDLAGAYTVTFDGTPPAIQELSLSNNANATFTSIGFLATQVSTLRVNSAGGSGDVTISNNAILTLGTSGSLVTPSKVLHLTVGDELKVQSGGTLNVRFGSDVVTRDLVMPNSGGQVNVIGTGSTLDAGGSIIAERGSLNVTAGGVVQSVSGVVGETGVGTATVSGIGSQWINSGSLSIGSDGDGTLDIIAGGKVQSLSGSVGIRDFSPAAGMVTVSGAGSQWNNSSSLSIGSDSMGTLNITAGGSVSSTDGFLGSAGSFSNGTATIIGGDWTMTGRLSVGGGGSSGSNSGTGAINIQSAGTVNATQGVVLFPDGVVRLQGGTLDTSAISFQGGGQFDWTSGTLRIGTYFGNLTNQGGTLAPGHSAGQTTINGFYNQQASAALEIEIGGLLAMHDLVNVTDPAFLGGQLQLKLIDDFTPAPTDSFTVLEAQGGIFGVFSNVTTGQRLTTIDGNGSFLVNYGPTSPFNVNQIVLTDFLAGLFPGDANGDGKVDGVDYLIWAGNYGDDPADDPPGSPGNGDLNNDGLVDGLDYITWASNYLQGPNDAAAVPEPASLSLSVFGCAAVVIWSRRVRKW